MATEYIVRKFDNGWSLHYSKGITIGDIYCKDLDEVLVNIKKIEGN